MSALEQLWEWLRANPRATLEQKRAQMIDELRWKITHARLDSRKEHAEWKRTHPNAPLDVKLEVARMMGRDAAREYGPIIEDCERQIRALEAPIVGIVVDKNNRVIIATQYCVYELRDDKLVLIEREEGST